MKLNNQSLFGIWGKYNEAACDPHNPSSLMTLFSGYALTDQDIIVRFFKPMPQGYNYKLSYKIEHTSGGITQTIQPTNFGPVFAQVVNNLQPNTTYEFDIKLYCDNGNNPIQSSRIFVTTLPPCK